MKKVLCIFLIIAFTSSFLGCSDSDSTDKVTKATIKKMGDLVFKSEYGVYFDTQSAMSITTAISCFSTSYKFYLEDSEYFNSDEIETLRLIISNLKIEKELYSSNHMEDEVFDKTISTVEGIIELSKMSDKLKTAVRNKEKNIGIVTQNEIDNRKEDIKDQEELVESYIFELLDYFE